MLFIRRSKNLNKRHSAFLYATVFDGALSMLVIFTLCASFLIQPFHKAIAAEPTDMIVEEAPVAEDVKEHVEAEIPAIDEPTEVLDTEQASSTADVEMPDTTNESTSEQPADEVQVDIPSDPTDSGQSDNSDPEDVFVDGSEESPENEDEALQAEDEVVSEPVVESVVQVESLINEDNFYQFSKQSCVAVGAGSYHCTNSTSTADDSQSVVFAGLDENGGDMEIFLRTASGKVRQLSDNGYDDTAPHFDPESMRVVWQRLIDGRYQIILLDLMEEKESQLTFSKTNNMEPKVSSNGIVWQAWDNNDWEIMLFDGSYTEQLTENNAQDVVPVVQDGYVLWNVLGGEEQQARVYSLETKETVSIVGHEGGSIVNPRFVLVYDTEYENGDIVTQSLDPETGLSEPIAAKPVAPPIDIPNSDPIGEIRALITNKSKDEKQFLDVEPDPDTGSSTTPISNDTLNLKSGSDSAPVLDIASTTLPERPFELTEYDLVIPQNALEDALQSTQE